MGLGLKNILVGEDPTQTESLWDKMYVSTCMSGRRGLGICAISAIDIALWDIKGKALGKPASELLGGPKQPRIRPYASLLPTGNTLNEYRAGLLDKLVKAKNYGFGAA
jgi:L-alanine-DL-glutamate epimerase-like enolase superfamily enzyme